MVVAAHNIGKRRKLYIRVIILLISIINIFLYRYGQGYKGYKRLCDSAGFILLNSSWLLIHIACVYRKILYEFVHE